MLSLMSSSQLGLPTSTSPKVSLNYAAILDFPLSLASSIMTSGSGPLKDSFSLQEVRGNGKLCTESTSQSVKTESPSCLCCSDHVSQRFLGVTGFPECLEFKVLDAPTKKSSPVSLSSRLQPSPTARTALDVAGDLQPSQRSGKQQRSSRSSNLKSPIHFLNIIERHEPAPLHRGVVGHSTRGPSGGDATGVASVLVEHGPELQTKTAELNDEVNTKDGLEDSPVYRVTPYAPRFAKHQGPESQGDQATKPDTPPCGIRKSKIMSSRLTIPKRNMLLLENSPSPRPGTGFSVSVDRSDSSARRTRKGVTVQATRPKDQGTKAYRCQNTERLPRNSLDTCSKAHLPVLYTSAPTHQANFGLAPSDSDDDGPVPAATTLFSLVPPLQLSRVLNEKGRLMSSYRAGVIKSGGKEQCSAGSGGNRVASPFQKFANGKASQSSPRPATKQCGLQRFESSVPNVTQPCYSNNVSDWWRPSPRPLLRADPPHESCCTRCKAACNIWELCQPVRCLIDQNEVEIVPGGSSMSERSMASWGRSHHGRKKYRGVGKAKKTRRRRPPRAN